MIQVSESATALLREFYGVASLDEFDAAGVSAGVRRRLIQIGVIEPTLRGVYRSRSAPVTEISLARSGCLFSDRLVVSGPASGRIWGFRKMPRFDGAVDFVAPPATSPLSADWVRITRCSIMGANDVVSRADGIRVLSPPASLVHLARSLDDESLESVIEQVLRDFCGHRTLVSTAHRFAAPRRPWAGRVLRILEQRGNLAPAESDPELAVFRGLMKAGIPVVQRQHWLSLANGAKVRLDIVDESIRWGVEVDIHPDHESIRGVARDKRRDRECHRLGWQVERVTALDMLDLPTLAAELAELHHLRLLALTGQLLAVPNAS
jgi:hypothetical protein